MRRMNGVREAKQAEHLTVLAEAAEVSSLSDQVLRKHTKIGRSYRIPLDDILARLADPHVDRRDV